MNDERYIKTLRRFATPEEFEKLLKTLGGPTDIEKRAIATDRIIERDNFHRKIRSLLWELGKVITAVGAVLVVIGSWLKPLLALVSGG